MNREQIMQLEGRELDEQIAKRIFNLIVDNALWFTFERVDSDFGPLKSYSSNISAAWEVLEKFHSHRLQKLENDDKRVVDGKVHQCFINKNANCAYGHTVTEAICKAALLAVMEVET